MADGTIIFNQRWQGQRIKNVTVWSNIPTTPTDRQSLADSLRGIWNSNLGSDMSDGWSLDSVTYFYNDSAPVFSVEVPFTPGPLVGGSAGNDLPSQVALLLSTQINGPPPNRGRFYLSGMTEFANNAVGQWEQSPRDNARGMLEVWAGGVSYVTNSAFLRIARRNALGIITLSSPVETVIPRANPATQRRRRRGQGI